MFSAPHYVPVIKLKAGELSALGEVGDRLRSLPVTPFFDVTPLVEDPDREDDRPLGEAHVSGVAEDIMDDWGRTDPVFIDAAALDNYSPGHPRAIGEIAEQASNTGFRFVPVTGLRRSREYQRAARWAAEQQSEGLGLRITPVDTQSSGLRKAIDQLLEYTGHAPPEVDFLLDYGAVPAGHHAVYGRDILGLMAELPYIEDWRTMTVAGSALPSDLSEKMSDNSAEAFDRSAWKMYHHVHQARDQIARTPAFGDYAVTVPSMEKYRVQPAVMRVTPKIKYTAEEQYVVVRGEFQKEDPYGQYRDLARRLTEMDIFEHSQTHADEMIQQYADGMGATAGGPQTWVKVGTARHLEKVGQQIASIPAP